MIKHIKERNFEFKHPLATIVAEEVEIGISDSGRRSISATEIERLSRLAALAFIDKHYRSSLEKKNFTISSKRVLAIMTYLKVNQSEFAKLIGCQKAKMSKILKEEQTISKPQAMLAIERLALEIARPGAIRNILGDDSAPVGATEDWIKEKINGARFSSPPKVA